VRLRVARGSTNNTSHREEEEQIVERERRKATQSAKSSLNLTHLPSLSRFVAPTERA